MRLTRAWLWHPDRRWTVLAALLFASGAAGLTASIIYTRSYQPTGDWPALHRRMQISNRIMWTGMIALFAGQFVLSIQGARKARRKERAKKGLCLECGYDLRESPTSCPECGAEVTTLPKS